MSFSLIVDAKTIQLPTRVWWRDQTGIYFGTRDGDLAAGNYPGLRLTLSDPDSGDIVTVEQS